MKILPLKPGKYVLALSGGVDSVVLLDLLKKQYGVELVLAHFNHGIRVDSHEDEELVKRIAAASKLKLEVGHGFLGKDCSEETARSARYHFLESVQQKHKAQVIITAHHQDDLIETAFLNILRGTNYRGLIAIVDNPLVIRPLISFSKKEIISYARSKGLDWREDGSNNDTKYLRNYIRIFVMAKLSANERLKILKIIEKVAENQEEQNKLIATLSHNINALSKIDRLKFLLLPLEVRNELLAHWMRQKNVQEFDKKTIQRLDLAIKTASAGERHPVKEGLWLKINSKTAELTKTF